MKRIKNAISYVVYDKQRVKFLVVKRPEDDEDLPGGVWGLPAGSVKEGETFEDAVVRSGKDKLNVDLNIVTLLNEGDRERKDYVLHMKLFEAKIVTGEPKLLPVKGITQYIDWKRGEESDLQKALDMRSLCCELYVFTL